MAIEFSQIHNLVRTYQRVLSVPLSNQSRVDRADQATADRVSISPQAREQEEQFKTEPISDRPGQQDKERPR